MEYLSLLVGTAERADPHLKISTAAACFVQHTYVEHTPFLSAEKCVDVAEATFSSTYSTLTHRK